MTLWLRVRRFRVLVGTVVSLGVFLVVAGNRQVMVPTIIGGGSSAILWASFMPLAWAAAIALAFEGRGAQVEARPGSRLPLLDTALLSGSTSAVVAFIAVFGPSSDVRLHLVAHVLILTGVATVVTLLVHAASGIMVATAILLATGSYSPYIAGAQFVRILQPEGNLAMSLALGAVLSSGALVLTARRASMNLMTSE